MSVQRQEGSRKEKTATKTYHIIRVYTPEKSRTEAIRNLLRAHL